MKITQEPQTKILSLNLIIVPTPFKRVMNTIIHLFLPPL